MRNINIPFDGWTSEEFIAEIDRLQEMNYEQYKENKKYFNVIDVGNVHKLNNEQNPRGAGRKPKITFDIISEVRKHRSEKVTYRDIALKMGLSLGLIHKASKVKHDA
jgi:hypothetical protein